MEGIPGLLINNLTHIKQLPTGGSRGQWKGSNGADPSGHATFLHPAYGLRATICDLSHDYCIEDKKTLKQLFAEYAPANDPNANNDPLDYAKFISLRIGMGIDQDIKLFNSTRGLLPPMGPLIVKRLLSAIVEYEIMATWEVEESLLTNAVLLYKRDYK